MDTIHHKAIATVDTFLGLSPVNLKTTCGIELATHTTSRQYAATCPVCRGILLIQEMAEVSEWLDKATMLPRAERDEQRTLNGWFGSNGADAMYAIETMDHAEIIKLAASLEKALGGLDARTQRQFQVA